MISIRKHDGARGFCHGSIIANTVMGEEMSIICMMISSLPRKNFTS
jgi:hypothetical protein